MSLADAIRAYLDSARADGRLAASSLKTWGSWLNRLARHIGPDAEIADLTGANLRRHLLELEKAGLRPRTLRSALFAWRALGRHLVDQKLLPANPAEGLRAPRLDQAQRERCTDADVQELLGACERVADDRRAALASAIVTVFAFTGLRRRECLGLKVRDLNTRERSITVNLGKGGKSRKVFLAEEQFAPVRAWLKQRGVCKHDSLWDFDHARRLGDEGLRTLLREVQAIAGRKGSRALLPHGLRHAFATRLARNGVELDAIREVLGHSSLATTAVYLHTEEERLREVSELAGFAHSREKAKRQEKARTSTWRQAAWRRGRAP